MSTPFTVEVAEGGVVDCGERATIPSPVLSAELAQGTWPAVLRLGARCVLVKWEDEHALLHQTDSGWSVSMVSRAWEVVRDFFAEPVAVLDSEAVEGSWGPRWYGPPEAPALGGGGDPCVPDLGNDRIPPLGGRGKAHRASHHVRVGACRLVWEPRRDGAWWFLLVDASGGVDEGTWTAAEARAVDDRLRWAEALRSAAERGAVPDVTTRSSPTTRRAAQEAFVDACAQEDWRVAVWALRTARPDALEGVPAREALRGCRFDATRRAASESVLEVPLSGGGVVACDRSSPDAMQRFVDSAFGPPRVLRLGPRCLLVRDDDETSLVHQTGQEWTVSPVSRPLSVAREHFADRRPPPPRASDVAESVERSWGPRLSGPPGARTLGDDLLTCPVEPAPPTERDVLRGWRAVGPCHLLAEARGDGSVWLLLVGPDGTAREGTWNADDVRAAEAALRWEQVLASVVRRPTDVVAAPPPRSVVEARAAFAEACAQGDWRVGIWALHAAMPDGVDGFPPAEVLARRCHRLDPH